MTVSPWTALLAWRPAGAMQGPAGRGPACRLLRRRVASPRRRAGPVSRPDAGAGHPGRWDYRSLGLLLQRCDEALSLAELLVPLVVDLLVGDQRAAAWTRGGVGAGGE